MHGVDDCDNLVLTVAGRQDTLLPINSIDGGTCGHS